MRKLLASIIVLIITTAISFIQTEIDSMDSVETNQLKKEVTYNNAVKNKSNTTKS